MNRSRSRTLIVLLSSIFLLGILEGCAPTVKHHKAEAGSQGRAVVPITASNFAFEPNVIEAEQGTTVVFRVRNVSGTGHNLTVEEPDGATLAAANLPAGATVEVQVVVDRSGTYPLYCDKPFHRTLGMKGEVRVR